MKLPTIENILQAAKVDFSSFDFAFKQMLFAEIMVQTGWFSRLLMRLGLVRFALAWAELRIRQTHCPAAGASSYQDIWVSGDAYNVRIRGDVKNFNIADFEVTRCSHYGTPLF